MAHLRLVGPPGDAGVDDVEAADVTLSVPPDPRAASAADPEATLPAGTAVGRYVVLEPLGRGGMSTVYRAEDPGLRRQVALKILRADLSLHVAACERFAREGHVMAQLTHPNVATVHDVGRHAGRLFLALELLEGGTLAGWMARPRPWREVVRMLAAAARGLAAAHAVGIVHRDFKPDNVLLGKTGVPRVGDFGLAGSLDGALPSLPAGGAASTVLTAAGTVLGTPAYMAPEQRDGHPADERADQYSLCLVWLEALGRDRATAAGDPGLARGPRWLVKALMRGLARDPARRWPSVVALLHAIDRRRARRRLALALAGTTAAAAVTFAAWPRHHHAATLAPRLIGQVKAGEGPWRMMLSHDGRWLVRSTEGRDQLLLEERSSGRGELLALPPGLRVSPRADSIPAVSDGGDVVIVRMEGGSVWRTGRALAAPVRLRADGAGAVCLHPSGDRVAIGPLDREQGLELRATDDGRLLGSAPQADLCTWLGDRLVLGHRDGIGLVGRVDVLDDDDGGGTHTLTTVFGNLDSLTVHGREVLIAHNRTLDPRARLGLITAVGERGAARRLVETPELAYLPIAWTEAGLFAGAVELSSKRSLGALPASGGPLELRSLATGDASDESAAWLDDDHLVVPRGDQLMSHAQGGEVAPFATVTGVVAARAGDELLVTTGAGDGCALLAVRPGHVRPVRPWPCDVVSLRCDGGTGCVAGQIDGDDVGFVRLDPATGAMSPPLLRRPLTATPAVDPGADGRWLVESAHRLAIVDPATGREQPVPTGALILDWALWDHGQRAVIAGGKLGGDFALARLSLDGRLTVLATSRSSAYTGPALSPDGRTLAILQTERRFRYLLMAPSAP